MKNDRHRAAPIVFRCSGQMAETISKIASEQRRSKSEVLRQLVDTGLAATGYAENDEHLKSVLDAAMKPHVERLAAISAKATQISSAAYFMSIFLLHELMPERSPFIEEAAGVSRQLGVEYLKLAKDRDLDEFLRSGAGKIHLNEDQEV